MMARARRTVILCGLTVATAALPACSNDEPGITVSVDVGTFAAQTRILRVALSALEGGFKYQGPTSVQNVGVSTEDDDGDSNLELVMKFFNPSASVSFRVATGNTMNLKVRGQALAFDPDTVIAADDGDPAGTDLPAGGRSAIALKLTERPPSVIGPQTRSTDVLTAPIDVKVGTTTAMHISAVAVCDVDGDGAQDLVLGAPDAVDVGLVVGGVYVVFGGNLAGEIDPTNPQTAMGFSFFGGAAGDRLGAAVACANVNGDNAADLIVGAPGAAAAYAVFGGRDIGTRSITPGVSGAGSPNVTWRAAAGSDFGAMLFAGDAGGDPNAEVMISEPMSKKVHLFAGITQAAAPVDVATAPHVTIINIRATALAAGDLRRAGKTDVTDVILGDADARMPNATMASGAIFGFADVPLTGAAQLDAAAPSMVMYGATGMQFGAAALVINTTGQGPDLIVGAPGDSDGAGAFYVYEGDDNFFDAPMRNYAMDEQKKIVTGPVANGRFGAALAATPTGSDWDLVVGAPGTARGDTRAAVGAAYLFGGGAGWKFPLREQVYGAATGDQLGTVVAGGRINSDAIGDLVALAPGAGADHNGVVYVRFGRPMDAP